MNSQLTQFLKELKQYGLKENIPNITETVGKFLNLLIKSSGAKNILEIGCANGYSTIWLAEAVKKNNGTITTIDFSVPTFEQAQENLKQVQLDQCVDFHLGNALKILPEWENKNYDFVFVDGQKASYLDFWKSIQVHLASEAIVIFDDILAFPEKTKSLTEHLRDIKDFEQVLLPIDQNDGILMLRKIN